MENTILTEMQKICCQMDLKLRGTNAGTNDTDGTTKYVYMAWAEAPASNLFGGQSNAR